ncbi:hypothetical protein [Rothia nasimurium]|uniref:hypothetical protein n=1 Tax=Rothia nasimurium TaxID=85336 RepID=UPI0016296A52|nr:hypothetical protein [Rothia nasimurium]
MTHSDWDHISGFSQFWKNVKYKPQEIWVPHDWIIAVLAAEVYIQITRPDRLVSDSGIISRFNVDGLLPDFRHIEISEIFSEIDFEHSWGRSEIYSLSNVLTAQYSNISRNIDEFDDEQVILENFSEQFINQPFSNLFSKFSFKSQSKLENQNITPSRFPNTIQALHHLDSFKLMLAFHAIYATKKVREILITAYKSGVEIKFFNVDNYLPGNIHAETINNTKLEIINGNPKTDVMLSGAKFKDWLRNTTEKILINERALISQITYSDEKKIIIWSDSSGLNVVKPNKNNDPIYKVDWNNLVIMTAPHHGSHKSHHDDIWNAHQPYSNKIICISCGGVASQWSNKSGLGLYNRNYLSITQNLKSCCWCRSKDHKKNQDITIDLNIKPILNTHCMRLHDIKNP